MKPNKKIVALNKSFRSEIKKYTDRKSPEYNPRKAIGLAAKHRAEERKIIQELKICQ